MLVLELRLFPLLVILAQWLALYFVNQLELAFGVLSPLRYALDKAGYLFDAFSHFNHFVGDFPHED